jgi:hypothetical protein
VERATNVWETKALQSGRNPMIVTRKYRYLYEDVTRHGQVRLYFWRGAGHRKIRIKEPRGTPEFGARSRATLAAILPGSGPQVHN